MHATHIRFLKNNQVDKQRWDECIERCPHGLIYSTSVYLDCMCPGWHAMVHEDYDWVMPLTSKTKFGISYLYQPPFTQQSGVFSKDPSVTIPWAEVLSLVAKKYKFWQYNFHYGTPDIFDESFNIKTATNFLLPLQQEYESIRQSYANDLLRNLEKSNKQQLIYASQHNTKLAIDTYITNYAERMPHVSKNDYSRFKTLVSILQKEGNVECRQVVNDRQELLAIALLLKDNRRLYNLMNSTTEKGRKIAANHFLMDAIIKEFEGQTQVFDFEGSDLPGVKTFYQNFGAINQPYFMVTYNNLPWPIKLLKR